MESTERSELVGSLVTGIGLFFDDEDYERAVRETFKSSVLDNDHDKIVQIGNTLFLLLNCYWWETAWNEDWKGDEPEITFQTLNTCGSEIDEAYEGNITQRDKLERNLRWLLDYGVITKDWKTAAYHFNDDFLEDYEKSIRRNVDIAYSSGRFKGAFNG